MCLGSGVWACEEYLVAGENFDCVIWTLRRSVHVACGNADCFREILERNVSISTASLVDELVFVYYVPNDWADGGSVDIFLLTCWVWF